MPSPQIILITGCSSGIGAALAEEFHGRGHRVFATARRIESLATLASKGMRTLAFGVRVVIVQPGGIVSDFGKTGEAHARLPENSLYKPIERFVLGRAKASQRGAMRAETFARVLADALLRPDPDPIIRLGTHSTRLPFLKRWLPTGVLDRKLRKLFGLDRLTRR